MFPPTMAQGLLGHFVCDMDPPGVFQTISPLPVWAPTCSSLRVILTAGARGGGSRCGMGRRRSTKEGSRVGIRVGEIAWDRVGDKGAVDTQTENRGGRVW